MPAPYYTPKAERLADLIDAELESGAMNGDEAEVILERIAFEAGKPEAFEVGDAEADEAREAEADYFETWRDEAEADIYATAEDF